MGFKTKFETQLDIMRLISKGASEPYELTAFLSVQTKELEELLESLVKQGILNHFINDFHRNVYSLTQKGRNILNYYKKDQNNVYKKHPWHLYYTPFKDLTRIQRE